MHTECSSKKVHAFNIYSPNLLLKIWLSRFVSCNKKHFQNRIKNGNIYGVFILYAVLIIKRKIFFNSQKWYWPKHFWSGWEFFVGSVGLNLFLNDISDNYMLIICFVLIKTLRWHWKLSSPLARRINVKNINRRGYTSKKKKIIYFYSFKIYFIF